MKSTDKIRLIDEPGCQVDMSIADFVVGIIATKGKNKGKVRISKPKIRRYVVEENGRQYHEVNPQDGMIAYVWRMFMFDTSSKYPHCYKPVGADYDLPYFIFKRKGRYEKKRQLARKLDEITTIIVNAPVPKSQQYGLMKWAGLL